MWMSLLNNIATFLRLLLLGIDVSVGSLVDRAEVQYATLIDKNGAVGHTFSQCPNSSFHSLLSS